MLQLVFSGLFMPLLDLLLIKDIWHKNSMWKMLCIVHLTKVMSSLSLTKQTAALSLPTNPSYHLSFQYSGVVCNITMSGIVLCAERSCSYNHRHTHTLCEYDRFSFKLAPRVILTKVLMSLIIYFLNWGKISGLNSDNIFCNLC